MNEETKNIETCLAENILSEVASVPTDPQFRSLVEESFDPLQQAGYDGYKEVVMYHQPYTFTSQVKQMKSNLILLLRRLWRYPFGRGNTAASSAGSASDAGSTAASAAAPIRSLADMWQHYITRLKGNAEYGIPSRLSQLTDLPSAPALLSDRDMSSGIRSGENSMPDGMSLAQLLCSYASSVTEIVDDNTGWAMMIQIPASFTALKKLTLNCETMYSSGNRVSIIYNIAKLEELYLPVLRYDTLSKPDGTSRVERNTISYCSSLKVIYADALEYRRNCSMHQTSFVQHCNALKYFYARSFEGFENCDYRDALISICPELINVYITSPTLNDYSGNNQGTFGGCPKLIHLEVGCYRLVDKSLNIKFWNPTTALDSSLTDLIEEGSTATNNLQQFLSNFRDYIAERLADNGTGKTLTLSQKVRNAIHAAEDEYGIENIIITKKGWTISPAPN